MDERYKDELVAAATMGMNNAFAILNNFPVGAAVLTDRGHIYQGCNIQSVISGMGVSAERCTIDHAIASGEYVFKAIAVISGLEVRIAPCGMCLQYIGEFSQVAGHDIEILMIGSNGTIRESSVQKMLPVIFGPVDLGLDVSRFQV